MNISKVYIIQKKIPELRLFHYGILEILDKSVYLPLNIKTFTSMEIIKADTIEQYNRFFGFQTKHPLVSIVHFDRSENQPTHKMTMYHQLWQDEV